MSAPTAAPAPARAITGAAFATLLLIALMMGANHVAARVAFNHGLDVATAVVFRSTVTAVVIAVMSGAVVVAIAAAAEAEGSRRQGSRSRRQSRPALL